jgi:hypothetical protein
VKIVELEIAQSALFEECREQPTHGSNVRVHAAAHIHQQEQANVVPALGPKHEFDLARIAARLIHRRIDIEFGVRSTAREVSQAFERNLRLPQIHRGVRAIVRETAVFCDLHCGTISTLPSHANSSGMFAPVSAG